MADPPQSHLRPHLRARRRKHLSPALTLRPARWLTAHQQGLRAFHTHTHTPPPHPARGPLWKPRRFCTGIMISAVCGGGGGFIRVFRHFERQHSDSWHVAGRSEGGCWTPCGAPTGPSQSLSSRVPHGGETLVNLGAPALPCSSLGLQLGPACPSSSCPSPSPGPSPALSPGCPCRLAPGLQVMLAQPSPGLPALMCASHLLLLLPFL